MNSEKLKELMQNEEFTGKIAKLEDKEDIQKVFKENGLDVSIEELEQMENEGRKLLEEGELEGISGGVTIEPVDGDAPAEIHTPHNVPPSAPGFWSGVGSGLKEAGEMFIKGPKLIVTGKDGYEKLGGVGYTGGATIILGGLFIASMGIGITKYYEQQKKKNKKSGK